MERLGGGGVARDGRGKTGVAEPCEEGKVRKCKVDCVESILSHSVELAREWHMLVDELLEELDDHSIDFTDREDITDWIRDQIEDPSTPIEALVEAVQGFQLSLGGEILKAGWKIVGKMAGYKFVASCKAEWGKCEKGKWVQKQSKPIKGSRRPEATLVR